MPVKSRFGFSAREGSQQQETGNDSRKNNDGFKHRVIASVVRQDRGDDVRYRCVVEAMFDIIGGYMTAGR